MKIPSPRELAGSTLFPQDDSLSVQGTLAGPLEGPILSAHAHQRSGGGLAQGASPSGPVPLIAYRSRTLTFYIDGTYSEIELAQPDTISGYPVTGSIATFTSDRKPQNEPGFSHYLPDVMRKYPPQEVGTGRLKFHTMKDGTRVTFCGTIRPDAEGNVAACASKPYEHPIIGLPNSCKRRGCPECYPYWSQKAARRVQQSVNGYILATVPENLKDALRKALTGLNVPSAPDEWKQLDKIQDVLDLAYDYLSRHIVISPPHDVVAAIVRRTEQSLERKGVNLDKESIRYRNEFHKIFTKKYRRKLDQVARLAGLTAYLEFGHNIRLRKDKDAMKADLRCDSNRYREVLNQPGWRHQVKFSPHSHLMAWGYLMPVEDFYEVTGGWVYKNLGVITNVSGLTNYLLSHAPDIEGVHSYRLGGDLKNYKVQGEIKIPIFRKCQECIDEGKSPETAGMILAKLKSVEYKRGEDRQNKIIAWEFKDNGLSSKPYRTTEIIPVYVRKPPDQRKPGIPAEDPPPTIAAWLSPEERERQLREWTLMRKERERIRKANQWVSHSQWEQMPLEDRQRFKWRKYFSPEEYAGAGIDWKVKMFEWS